MGTWQHIEIGSVWKWCIMRELEVRRERGKSREIDEVFDVVYTIKKEEYKSFQFGLKNGSRLSDMRARAIIGSHASSASRQEREYPQDSFGRRRKAGNEIMYAMY